MFSSPLQHNTELEKLKFKSRIDLSLNWKNIYDKER